MLLGSDLAKTYQNLKSTSKHIVRLGFPKASNIIQFLHFTFVKEKCKSPNWLFQFLTPLPIFLILEKCSQHFRLVHSGWQKVITIVVQK